MSKLTELESRYVALKFGAPTDNQTIDAIADPFNRERAKAFVAYERERQKIWLAYVHRWFGATNGTTESLPKATRTEAMSYIAKADADYSAWHRTELRFPAVLRATSFDDLLNPSLGNTEEPTTFGEVGSMIDNVECAVPPGWTIEGARVKFTTMNQYRLRFLCLFHGSTDESIEGVPAAARAEWEELVQYHDEERQKFFEGIVSEFGASTGFAEDIQSAAAPGFLLYLATKDARFTNACRYELELERIDRREAAGPLASDALAMFG